MEQKNQLKCTIMKLIIIDPLQLISKHPEIIMSKRNPLILNMNIRYIKKRQAEILIK